MLCSEIDIVKEIIGRTIHHSENDHVVTVDDEKTPAGGGSLASSAGIPRTFLVPNEVPDTRISLRAVSFLVLGTSLGRKIGLGMTVDVDVGDPTCGDAGPFASTGARRWIWSNRYGTIVQRCCGTRYHVH